MGAWETYQKTMVAPPSLWSAAKDNDVSMLEALLEGDLDIDAVDPRGFSPLMLAAYAGHVEAFDCLLAHGANPNGTDLAGNSILMGAAFKGHLGLVRKLLDAGANLAWKNAAGLDARAFALTFGRTDVIELFDQAR